MKRRLLFGALLATSVTGCSTSSSPAAGGTVVIAASGEVLSLSGYSFPPQNPDDPAFVDGWEVRFDRVLVTLDHVVVTENPDRDPGNEAATGAVVAGVDGPWAVDLHKGGPLPGKGGGDEQAVELARLDNQNRNGGKAFETDARYGFGFDIVAASASAKPVNLDKDALADYEAMQAAGLTVLYVGTATFKGDGCAPADPTLDALPTTVPFRLGFKSPTTYANCQNPDNDPAKPLGDEEHERGLFLKSNQAVTAQLTVHTDHPFWESFVHDSPAHFDMVAAQAAGKKDGSPVALEDLRGVDPTAITTGEGKPIPFRSCLSTYAPPRAGQLSFDTTGLRVDRRGDPSGSIRDLYDFMTYNQSTQGHLNSDGLCAVKRNYPSPP